MSNVLAQVHRPPSAASAPDRIGATLRLLAGVAIVSAVTGSLLTAAVWGWLHEGTAGLPPAPAAVATQPQAVPLPLGRPAVHEVLTDRAEPPSEPPPAS